MIPIICHKRELTAQMSFHCKRSSLHANGLSVFVPFDRNEESVNFLNILDDDLEMFKHLLHLRVSKSLLLIIL